MGWVAVMQVTVETVSKLERKLRITVPSEQIDGKVEEKIKQAAAQARIKGFRPGKVPVREVRRRFGAGILQEVSGEVMQQSFSEAVTQQDLKPAGMPAIDDVVMETGKDLSFSALIEIFPEVKPGQFGEISITRPVAEVMATDLDAMIDKLREQRKKFESVDRPAAEEDQVTIDFTGTVDGEAFEGGQGEGHQLVLGSGSMIPGFEAGIVGLSASESKDVSVTFPEDYQAEDLAGKDAVFSIIVHQVEASVLPELDDEFYKEFGVEAGGMEAFKVEVQNNMEKELKAAVDNRVKTQVMDGLVEVTSLDVPKALIDDECERMRQDMMRQFGGGQQIDPNMLPLELFSDQADRRVRLGLIVNAIVEQENVVTDEDAVRAKIEEIASSYEEPEQLINYYYSNEQQLNQVQSLVLEEQIVALVLASAQVIDEPVSYDEAIKPPAPESSDEDDANQTSDADADLAPEPDQSAETDDEAPAAEVSPEAVNKEETKD